MFSIICKDRVMQYQSPNDPNKDNPTVFKLGVLDVILKCHIEDSTTSIKGTGELQLDLAYRSYLTVKLALKGIDGLIDDKGNPVAVETEKVAIRGRIVDVIKDDILNALPKELFPELAEVINNNSNLIEAEKKI